MLENNNKNWVSGYRLMWVLVMFDLPVVDKTDRKAYSDFRNFLLNNGFDMAQYSIYFRIIRGKEAAETIIKKIEKNLPEYGSINILTITDKQYENMVCFQGKRKEINKKPEQLSLF